MHRVGPGAKAEQILDTLRPAPSSETSLERFQDYLSERDVARHFSVPLEVCAPHDMAKAMECGYREFVPPEHMWPVAALLMHIADRCRDAVGEPVTLRNYWRPMSYNRLVSKSSIDSDHPNACGIDLDFASISSRQLAQEHVEGLVIRTNNAVRLSIGLGARSLHIGVLNGSRYWTYGSFDALDEKVPQTFREMASW